MILVSWADREVDPLNKEGAPGPNLTLLFDPHSMYRNQITEAYFFYQAPRPGIRGQQNYTAAQKLKEAIAQRSTAIKVHLVEWKGEDVSELLGLYAFFDEQLRLIGEAHPQQELVVHMSPGPKMVQTSLVVMAGAGVIREPFSLVKSIHPHDRIGADSVAKVNFRLPTLYNRLVDSMPVDVAGDKKVFFWDPNKIRSDVLWNVFEQAKRYARMQTPVMIMGERGTGKTSLASWIRIHSPYRKEKMDAAWVSVPCGQYSPELMRSELFGYVKGAFTGALNKDKKGLVSKADGDTLFLDEIGDISKEVQRLLIRALEDGTYTPVGSDKIEKSSFRLLTATNKTWEELQGALGADFLDRISQLMIYMPPVRMLAEDMHWIWHEVYEEAQKRAKLSRKLSPRDHEAIIDLLLGSSLPGNLRDLYRVANHLLGAEDDAPVERVVTSALHRGLDPAHVHEQNVAQKMAYAFALGMPLSMSEFDEDTLDIKEVNKVFRKFIAEEIRAMAKRMNVKPQALCNVSERTLQLWVKEAEG